MKIRVLLLLLVTSALAVGQEVADPQAVLSRARQAYYSLDSEGIASFQCTVTPNWETLLVEQRKSDPAAADAAIKILSQIHFTASVLPDKTTLTHNELTGQSAQMQSALSQIYGGMQQMLEGFFDTWKAFVWNSPFPAVNSTYHLQDSGSIYSLTYREDAADVVTIMDKDYAITSLAVTTPQFKSALSPGFFKSGKGTFVMNKYNAVYQSDKPEEATALNVLVNYQTVNEAYLPQSLTLNGTYGASAFNVQVAFSGCQVERK